MSFNDHEKRPLLFPALPGTSNINHIEEGSISIRRSVFNINKTKKRPKTQEIDDNDDTPDSRAFHFAIRGSVIIVFVCILSVVLVAYTVPYNVRFGRRKGGPNLVEDSSVTEIDKPVLAIPKGPLMRAVPLDRFGSSNTMTTSAKDNIKVRDEDPVEDQDSITSSTSTVSIPTISDSISSSNPSNTIIPGHSTSSTVNIKGPIVDVVEEEETVSTTTVSSIPATGTTKVSDEIVHDEIDEKIIESTSTKIPPPPPSSQDITTTTTTSDISTVSIPPPSSTIDETETTTSIVTIPSSSGEDKPVKTSDQLNTPNFLFVLADDLGYNSISEEIAPFMYKIRSQGVNIPQYYTADVCTPARASLLTGRYPLTLGWQYDEHIVSKPGGLNLDETTFAEILQDNKYTTYMFGKWNLGNLSPRYLPTARGFNYFLGFLNGYTYYWSKLYPYHPNFKDFMYADNMCFYGYDSMDMKHYSTNLYKDKAVAAIEAHDYAKSSLFMYISSQAVHDPFADNNGKFPDGVPRTYMNPEIYDHIYSTYQGGKVREYYKSLAVLDRSIEAMHNAFDRVGVLDNTYIIFASDNGGCPAGGGRNYPLRGTKGSLFEGGVRVEAFVYSTKLPESLRGTEYQHLFHVTDWFPTILSLANIPYTPVEGYELDGVNHHNTMLTVPIAKGVVVMPPREHMLINYYYNPAKPTETHMTSIPMAVRNAKYKLLHTYDSLKAGSWYSKDEVADSDDDLLTQGGCAQAVAWKTGSFTYYLFDLENDPNETTNLYNSSPAMKLVQEELYSKLGDYTTRAVPAVGDSSEPSKICFVKWKDNNDFIIPWATPEEASEIGGGRGDTPHPDNCGLFTVADPKKIPPFMYSAPRGKGNY